MNARTLERHEEVAGDDALVYSNIARRMKWWMNRPFAKDIVSLGIRSGRVLDVGCGPGYSAIYLARYAPGVTISALDISPEMHALVRENAARAGLSDRIVPAAGDMKNLPFAAGTFDAVVSSLALHHLAEPGEGIDEMLRVLKPGGGLLVKDLIRPTTMAKVHWLVEFFGTALGYGRAEKEQYRDSLRAAFSWEEIQTAAEKRGLEVERTALSCFRLIRRPKPKQAGAPAGGMRGEVWDGQIQDGVAV